MKIKKRHIVGGFPGLLVTGMFLLTGCQGTAQPSALSAWIRGTMFHAGDAETCIENSGVSGGGQCTGIGCQ